MRGALLLVIVTLARSVSAQEALPPEEEAGPVADDSRSEPHTVPNEQERVPISSSTDYGGGFDPPWTEEPMVERSWYGWQTLLSDAVSVGLMVSAANGHADERGSVGAFGYALGGPIIHLAHGHAGKAGGSLGLRLGAPVVGVLIGFGIDDCERTNGHREDEWCGFEGAIGGFIVGIALAVLVDAAVIANEDVEAGVPHRAETGVRLRPDIRVANNRAQLSLAGSF
jgi:hypothetical protein